MLLGTENHCLLAWKGHRIFRLKLVGDLVWTPLQRHFL